MTVYVDKARTPFGRLVLSHMLADTRDELLVMVDRIGVNRKHIQFENTPREHFDVCESKRRAAIRLGAIEVSSRFIAHVIRSKRAMQLCKMQRLPTITTDFGIASGECVCDKCGYKYYDHPMDYRIRSDSGTPFLNVLCDGRLVKL